MIFLDNIEKVDVVVESDITVNYMFVFNVFDAARHTSKKVTPSKVPPFIRDETLITQLAKHGQVVSPIRKVPSGCKTPLLRHVVSHRRNVLMILKNRTEELSLDFKIRVDEFDYVSFVCFFSQ